MVRSVKHADRSLNVTNLPAFNKKKYNGKKAGCYTAMMSNHIQLN